MDIYSMALVKVGSGSNMPGYYMYHGGTNPEGAHTTLQETQASPMTNHNELPVKSYDFQAPLGEFGQLNPQYHLLRRMHLFLQDFGGELALMQPYFPDSVASPKDTASLRWSVRSNGSSGYVFVNNYQRLQHSPAKPHVKFRIDLPGQQLSFPATPITVPANSSFFLPFNMQLGAITLQYATAQPIARIQTGDTLTVFFAQQTGIPADFVFNGAGTRLEYTKAKLQTADGLIQVASVPAGTGTAILLRGADKALVQIVLLDEKTSLNLWKGRLAGKEFVLLSASALTCNGNELELTGSRNTMQVLAFPAPQSVKNGTAAMRGKANGVFRQYQVAAPVQAPLKAVLTAVQPAGPLRNIKTGVMKVAEAPSDADFENAAVWKITLPRNLDKNRDVYLKLPYTGDVARVYAGNRLLTDNFYNGKPLELGLKRYSGEIPGNTLTVKILPLQQGAPVYFQRNALPVPAGNSNAPALPRAEVYEQYTVKLQW
jgi:hypothetical protein